MAIVALALWTLTAAAGVYLLASSTRRKPGETAAPEKVMAAVAAPAVRKRDRFDPPSLREAKREPLPGLRALGEFTHPALALTGFAFWLLYTMAHDRIFGAIALGVLLGAIAAGIAWTASNTSAARRKDAYALSFPARALALHIAGATLTLLLAALLIATALRAKRAPTPSTPTRLMCQARTWAA